METRITSMRTNEPLTPPTNALIGTETENKETGECKEKKCVVRRGDHMCCCVEWLCFDFISPRKDSLQGFFCVRLLTLLLSAYGGTGA